MGDGRGRGQHLHRRRRLTPPELDHPPPSTPLASPAWGPIRRLTVVGRSRRADVSLPADVGVALLVTDLVRLLGLPSDEPGRLALGRIGMPTLDGELTLAEQGVIDGEILYLLAETDSPPAPVVDDFAAALADAVEAAPGAWSGAWRQGVALGLGTAGLAVSAWAWARVAGLHSAGGGLGLAAGALVLVAAAIATDLAWRPHQGDRRRAAPMAFGLAALPWAALAGLSVATRISGAGALARGTGACAGLVVAALVLMLASTARPVAMGALVAALPTAIAGVVCLAANAPAWRGAAGLVVWWPLAAAGLVRWTARVAGLQRPRRTVESPAGGGVGAGFAGLFDSGARRLRSMPAPGEALGVARPLLLASAIGVGTAGALAIAVVGMVGRPMLSLLGLASAVALLLAARSLPWAPAVAGLAAGATGAFAALEATALRRHLGSHVALALMLVSGLVAAGLGLIPRRPSLMATARHRVTLIEMMAVSALLPLALGALGVFGAVEHAASHFF
jgi:type VII secretion integral membrane protein EccD